MTRTVLFSLFFALLGQTYLLAQQASKPPERIRFEHLTVADGLPENSVSCIIQDHLGFIWMGTYDGLVRYDGTQITEFQYDPANKYSYNGHFTGALHEDKNGNIWVGSESLFRYERDTGRFIDYDRKVPKISRNYNMGFIGFIHRVVATG